MRGLWRLRLPYQYAMRVLAWAEERRGRARALRALAQFPAIADPRAAGLADGLIVSLTSYPPRYPTLALTLKSLLDQTVRADRTILWIADGDPLPPADVMALERHGLEVRRCPDLRSYKKLLPALAAFPDAVIVTADDDVYYTPDWLERLVAAYDPAQPAIVCHRAHLARFDGDGRLLPYLDWELETGRTAAGPHSALFPTGVGGVLYPTRILPAAFQDVAAIAELCPHADDVWFFAMAQLADVPRVNLGERFLAIVWSGTQEGGLFHRNVHGGENDAQLRALEARYGQLDGGQAPAATSDAGLAGAA